MVIYICGVAWLCFANFNKLQNIQKFILGIPTDKVVHFCMFLPFVFIAFFSLDHRGKNLYKVIGTLLCICSFGCIFAGLTEIVQGSLPYRTEDIKDFATDCLSIGIATLTVFFIEVSKRKKI